MGIWAEIQSLSNSFPGDFIIHRQSNKLIIHINITCELGIALALHIIFIPYAIDKVIDIQHLLRVIPVIGILPDIKAFMPTLCVAEVEAVFDAPLEMFLKVNSSEILFSETDSHISFRHLSVTKYAWMFNSG